MPRRVIMSSKSTEGNCLPNRVSVSSLSSIEPSGGINPDSIKLQVIRKWLEQRMYKWKRRSLSHYFRTERVKSSVFYLGIEFGRNRDYCLHGDTLIAFHWQNQFNVIRSEIVIYMYGASWCALSPHWKWKQQRLHGGFTDLSVLMEQIVRWMHANALTGMNVKCRFQFICQFIKTPVSWNLLHYLQKFSSHKLWFQLNNP
jgi:hypothetical protein